MERNYFSNAAMPLFKDADLRKGIVTGYFASFNTKDSDNDIILPGAFTKSINESGPNSTQPRVKHLLNHDYQQPLGVIQVLREDEKGLYYESQIGTHALGMDFIKMVDSGLITEHSIGYGVVKKEVQDPDADWRDQTTLLKELKLWEGSCLTAWGANQNTPLTGMKLRKKAEKQVPLLIKALRNGAFTEKTFAILENELLFLQKALCLNETTEPDSDDPDEDTTQPNGKSKTLNVLKLMNANMEMRLAAIH